MSSKSPKRVAVKKRSACYLSLIAFRNNALKKRRRPENAEVLSYFTSMRIPDLPVEDAMGDLKEVFPKAYNELVSELAQQRPGRFSVPAR